MSIDVIFRSLAGRRQVDLDSSASEASAMLLLEAADINPAGALEAAARLLPRLMYAYAEPISALLAAAFPLVYRELAKDSEVPDLLKFVPFVDWDRCKAARRELVFAFLSSSWPPGDIALTACRCNDVEKIFRRIARSWRGSQYINRISEDLNRLPDRCRAAVLENISEINLGR